MSQNTFTADAAFIGAHVVLDALMQALRDGCHVMMTPPTGTPAYEVSIFRDDDEQTHYGSHPTDPQAALLVALMSRRGIRP